MRGYRHLATLIILACTLSGCGSVPNHINPHQQAYWMNPFWQAALLSSVQRVVHLPANAATPASPRINGTVKFLFENGAVKDPVMVASTGNSQLDKLLLQQVVTAKVLKPFGLHTDQPHEFELPLEMFTPYESFEYNIYASIDDRKAYPRESLLRGSTGNNIVGFDYLDGKATNIIIIRSSHSNALDKSSISAISNADLPAPPSVDIGKAIHLEFVFCYDLNTDKDCPKGENIIYVLGTRIRM